MYEDFAQFDVSVVMNDFIPMCQVYQASAEKLPTTGFFYPPTLITGVQTVSRVVVEEVSSSLQTYMSYD